MRREIGESATCRSIRLSSEGANIIIGWRRWAMNTNSLRSCAISILRLCQLMLALKESYFVCAWPFHSPPFAYTSKPNQYLRIASAYDWFAHRTRQRWSIRTRATHNWMDTPDATPHWCVWSSNQSASLLQRYSHAFIAVTLYAVCQLAAMGFALECALYHRASCFGFTSPPAQNRNR